MLQEVLLMTDFECVQSVAVCLEPEVREIQVLCESFGLLPSWTHRVGGGVGNGGCMFGKIWGPLFTLEFLCITSLRILASRSRAQCHN